MFTIGIRQLGLMAEPRLAVYIRVEHPDYPTDGAYHYSSEDSAGWRGGRSHLVDDRIPPGKPITGAVETPDGKPAAGVTSDRRTPRLALPDRQAGAPTRRPAGEPGVARRDIKDIEIVCYESPTILVRAVARDGSKPKGLRITAVILRVAPSMSCRPPSTTVRAPMSSSVNRRMAGSSP